MTLADHHERVSEVLLELSDLPPAERADWIARHDIPADVLQEALALLALDDGSSTLSGGADLVVGSLAAELSGVPERVGPYQVTRRLGRGAMGEVFAARRPHPDREVALKVVRTRLTGDAALARFHLEVELLGRLDHPGIVTLLEAGTTVLDDGSEAAWFAMPLVAGRTLDEATRGWPLRARVEVVRRIAEAVAHAHERGVVHRDLKPANVLVDDAGRPHVLDFGIARSVTGGSSARTMTGTILGTVAYMSPEQASGDTAATDSRTDVYALGVILYELLTGRLPIAVEGSDLLRAALRVVRDEPAPMTGVPRDLQLVTLTCLEKDPRRRYPTAHLLADDLGRWLEQRPVSARAPSPAYVLTRFVQRHRALTLGAAAVLVAGALGLAGTLAGYRQARLDRDEAIAAQDRARAVEEYLLGTFSAASADRLGREATVGDAIDASLPTLDGALGREPSSKARVQVAVARLYHALERDAEAEALVDEALGVLEARLPPEAEEVLQARALRAELRAGAGDEEQALAELADLAARSAVAHGEDAPITLAVAAQGLRLAAERLEPEERARRASELVADATRTLGPTAALTLDLRGLLGRALLARGDDAGAERELREVLAIAEATHGVDGVETLRRRQDLLDLLDDHQRYEERIPVLEVQLAAQERRLGEAHRATRNTLMKLALAQLNLGHRDASRATFERLLERSASATGDSVEERVASHSALAAAWRDLGDPARSEELAREGLRLAADLPETNAWRAKLGLHLARAVLAQGRTAEAADLFRAAIPPLEVAIGPADEITLKGVKDLGTALVALGRPEEALAEYQVVLDRGTARLGAQHVIVRAALHESGAVLRDLGRYDEARERLTAYLRSQEATGKQPLFWMQALLEVSKLQRMAPDPSLAHVPELARAFLRDECPKDAACAKHAEELVAELGAP